MKTAKLLLGTLLIALIASQSFADILYCAKPGGQSVRQYFSTTKSNLNAVGAKLANAGVPFLVIAGLQKQDADNKSYRETFFTAFSKAEKFEPLAKEILGVKSVSEQEKLILARKLMKDRVWDEKSRYVYLYDSKQKLTELSGGVGNKDGVSLQIDMQSYQALLAKDTDEANGFRQIVSKIAPAFIITDGSVPFADGYFDALPASMRPAVLRVRGNSAPDDSIAAAAVSRALLNPDIRNAVAINLLPTSLKEAKPWNYIETDAMLYVDAGKRFSASLKTLGVPTASDKQRRNKAALLQNLKELLAAKTTVVLNGETAGNGEGIRIPGSTELITAKDLDALPNRDYLIVLACLSANIVNEAGLSVVGRIYSDKARKILQAMLMPQTKSPAEAIEDPRYTIITGKKTRIASLMSELLLSTEQLPKRQGSVAVLGSPLSIKCVPDKSGRMACDGPSYGKPST